MFDANQKMQAAIIKQAKPPSVKMPTVQRPMPPMARPVTGGQMPMAAARPTPMPTRSGLLSRMK